MAMLPWISITAVLVFAGACCFFSLAETALLSLSKWQIHQIEERNRKSGERIMRLLAQPKDLLATLALGHTFALAGMFGVTLWEVFSASGPVGWFIAGLLILSVLAGEVLPKTLAVRRPERWAMRVAGTVALIQEVTRPLHRVAQRLNEAILRAVIPSSVEPAQPLTEAEYQELFEMAFQQGTLRQSERDIILQIINMDRRTVKEVMRPRAQMAAISDDSTVEEMIASACKHKHSRLPMFDESLDTIVGVLNTRALLMDPKADLADVIEFPSFVPESMNLLQLLKSLQRQRRGLAIVLDEFGSTAGVVTMEDILGELVGGLRAEHDLQGFVMEKLGAGRWRVSGTMRLEDFRREYPALGEPPEVETMGGLLVSLMDVVPAQGESAQYRGLKLTAHVADERRVRELLVEETKS